MQCGGLLKVVLGDLQVMLVGHLRAVSQPSGHNVSRESFAEFRLPAASQVMRDSWPRGQSGPFDDSGQTPSNRGVAA